MSTIESVRSVLSGSSIALVGGDPRPRHVERLKQAFNLEHVVWLPTRANDASSHSFSSFLRRRSVALVVVLYGLIRHQHARDLRALCRDLDVPVVGYWRSPHPDGLASAIVEQRAVDALRRRAA